MMFNIQATGNPWHHQKKMELILLSYYQSVPGDAVDWQKLGI